MLELPDMVKEEVMPRGARMGIRGGFWVYLGGDVGGIVTWEKKLLLLTAEGWRYPAEPMSSIGDHSSWQRELKRERSEPLSVCPVSKAVYQEPISMHCPAGGYG